MSERAWRLGGVLLALAYGVKVVVPLLLSPRYSVDFLSYYLAARVCARGGNMYDIGALRAVARRMSIQAHVFPYLYPPPLACVLAPLARWPFWVALRAWALLMLVLLAATLYLTYLWLKRGYHVTHPGIALALGALAFLLPFDVDLMTGQVNILVVLLIVAALYAIRVHRQEIVGGGALGLAALVKLSPALLLPYFLVERQWNVMAGFAASLVGVGLMSFALVPHQWQNFLGYLGQVGRGASIPGLFPLGATSNMAPASVWALLMGDESQARVAAHITALIVLAVVIGVHARRRRREKESSQILLSYLVAMILSVPYVYIHHVVYLYPGVALWVGMALQGRRLSSPRLWGALALTAIASVNITLYSEVFFLRALPPLVWRVGLFALAGLLVLGLQGDGRDEC